MVKTGLIRVVAMIVMALVVATPASAQDATPSPATNGDLEAATSWLIDQQMEDGAFAGFTGEADAGTTVDAMIALASAQDAGVDTGTSIDDALAYVASGDVVLVYEQIGVGQAAKLSLALIATGEDPLDFQGYSPLMLVENGQDHETGVYGSGVYDHAYAMMALAAADMNVPGSALDALTAMQAEKGGWTFDGTTDPANADSNTTSMVVQALVASGNADHETMAAAQEFLGTTVTDDGAAYAPGADPDANSTALVLQAMIATDGDTSGLETVLGTFQAESGAFFYQAADMSENLFATAQAIPAQSGLALPVTPAGEATPAAILWDMAA